MTGTISRTRKRAPLALSALASVAALGGFAHAQECVDLYLQSTEQPNLLLPCTLAQSFCEYADYTKVRIAGGGTTLQDTILAYIGYPEPLVFEVGPDIEPAPGVVEVYDAISIDAGSYPAGITVIAKWGPAHATIAGGPNIPPVQITNTGGEVRVGYAANKLVMGDLVLPDYYGWYGFTITGGSAFTPPNGGGVRVLNVDSRVDISGNIVTGNLARQSGAGIFLDDCDETFIALNEIHGNSAGEFGSYPDLELRGGGVYQDGGFVEYYANVVHDNGFGADLAGFDPEPARQGGGIAANLPTATGVTVANMCGNHVYRNAASEGGGIWVDASAHQLPAQANLEFNLVEDNLSWAPGIRPTGIQIDGAFRGGGVFLGGTSTPVGFPGGDLPPAAASVPFPGYTLSLTLFNNRLRANTVVNPGFGPTAVDEVGGGLYSEVERNDDTDRVALIGNAAWQNAVPEAGAGFYVDHYTTAYPAPLSGEIYHNTLVHNDVLRNSGAGAGIYLTGRTIFDGSSNVIFFNRRDNQIVPDNDWFGEPGVVGTFRYCQMPRVYLASADLFGMGSDNADPSLVPDDWHLSGDGSPCVDSAEDAITVIITMDADNGPRDIDRTAVPGPGRDRGADELLTFLRGDANADGCVDIADAEFILAALFIGGSPSPVCMDAADANDDGNFDISDATRVLDYLFASGDPFPGNVGACLLEDPTPDLLPTGPGTPCICP